MRTLVDVTEGAVVTAFGLPFATSECRVLVAFRVELVNAEEAYGGLELLVVDDDLLFVVFDLQR